MQYLQVLNFSGRGTMLLKERIYDSIENMNLDELVVVYDHIQLMEQMKQASCKSLQSLPIETILDMTSSSESCWSDTVRSEREERV
jgi:hypothetical protein